MMFILRYVLAFIVSAVSLHDIVQVSVLSLHDIVQVSVLSLHDIVQVSVLSLHDILQFEFYFENVMLCTLLL